MSSRQDYQVLPDVFIAPPPFAETLLWNSAGSEDAITLPCGYGGKLYCACPEVLALAEGGQLAPLKKDACPKPHLSPTPHVPSAFSPGSHCTDTESAGENARAHVGEGASSRELLDRKKHLVMAIKCC